MIDAQLAKLVFVLSISFGSLLVGYAAKTVLVRFGLATIQRVESLSKYLKLFTLIVLIPIPVINAFWKFALPTGSLIFMPVAFTALVAPSIYRFDLDLANSG